MSISAYTGLPGHGKSYSVVEAVISLLLKEKRTVYTNIPMNDALCLEKFQHTVIHFEIDDILDNDNWFQEVFEPGAVLVIDEVWRLWPAGLKTSNVQEQHKSFLAEHRHMVGDNGKSTEIYLVTQDLSQIAVFARSLVENTFLVTKQTKVGMNKNFRVSVYYGAVTGISPPASKLVNTIHGRYKKEVTDLYVSHTKSVDGVAGDETRADKRFNALGSLKVKAFIGFFVFLVGSIIYMGFSFADGKTFNPDAGKPKQSKKVMVAKNGTYVLDTVVQDENKKLRNELQELKRNAKKELFYSIDDIAISFNNGIFPDNDFIFTFEISGQDVEITRSEVENSGYTVVPINACFAKIQNQYSVIYARCKSDTNRSTFFTELASTSE